MRGLTPTSWTFLQLLYYLHLFFLIGSRAELECIDEHAEYNDLDPCEYGQTLITNLGPCDGIMSGLELIDEAPMVYWPEAEVEKEYTVIMVDADAPTPAFNYHKYYVMWYLTEVKGTGLQTGEVLGVKPFGMSVYEKPFTEYNPYGVHRYQIYLFEQIGPKVIHTLPIRNELNLSRWATKYNSCLRAAYQIYGTFEFTPTVTFWDDSGRKTRSTPLVCGCDSLFTRIQLKILLSLIASFLFIRAIMN